MSLINQMLRDLQKQQDGKPDPDPPEKSRPGLRERLPRLPLPLLAGAGVGLLFLVCWWLAGALDDGMFNPEPNPAIVAQQTDTLPADVGALSPQEYEAHAEEAASSAVDETVLTAVEEKDVVVVVEEEIPVAEVVVASAPVAKAPIVKPSPVKKAAPVRKTVAVKKTNPVKKSRRPAPKKVMRSVAGSNRKVLFESTTPPFVRKPETTAKRQDYASAKPLPKKLHPDQLPGAVVPRVKQQMTSTPFGNAEEAFLQGQREFRSHRKQEAVLSLQRALQLYSGHMPARELLADIQTKEGRIAEAMTLLSQGLEIAPDYMPFKKRQVKLLIRQGDMQAAVEVLLTDGMPTVEEDPEAHVLLASIYQRLGEPFLAAQTYRNLLVAWPQTGAFWVGLGRALETEGLAGEARKAYQQALATEQLSDGQKVQVVSRLEQM